MTQDMDRIETPPAPIPPQRKKGRKARRWIIPTVALLLVAAVVLIRLSGSRTAADGLNGYVVVAAESRSITETLEGTGPLMPADSYTVTSLIEGEVLEAAFKEGDVVAKDAELYRIDSADVSTGIERAELTVAQSRRTYEARLRDQQKLTVVADASGTVTAIAVEPGDTVQSGQTVASIRDSDTLKITLPFAAHLVANMQVGQTASVTLADGGGSFPGSISDIAGADTFRSGNYATRDITVEIPNPGALALTQQATAVIGGEESLESGTFAYKTMRDVKAEVGGEVSAIRVPAGSKVSEGDAILQLTSDATADAVANAAASVHDAELALANQMDQRDAYVITSPIRGTIVERSYKQGDTLKAGEVLCRIYDLTYLEMSLPVDELDIAKISVGQTVQLTAAAVPDKVYEGRVTRININGTTNGNVTTYPVTIRIDKTEGLLPGMNVDADIVVRQVADAVSIPAEALLRGDTVLVRTSGGAAPTGQAQAATSSLPVKTSGTKSDASASLPAKPFVSKSDASANTKSGGLPAGYREQTVKTGVSDGSYIEILDGLKVGDEIAYLPRTAGSSGLRPGMFPGGRQVDGGAQSAPGGQP